MRSGVRRRSWPSVLLGALAVLALTAATAVGASASRAAAAQGPHGSGGGGVISSPAAIAALRAQVRAGDLTTGHGVIAPCQAAHLHCRALVVAGAAGSSSALRSRTPVGLSPAELQRAFGLQGAPGRDAMVTIVGQGAYPKLAADLAVYRSTFGLPACTRATGCLKIASYTGGSPITPGAPDLEEGLAYETSLDVDMVSAACPTCRITYLQVPASAGNDEAIADFATAVVTAEGMGSATLSISYGYDVSHWSDFGKPSRQLLQPGMGIFSASGDFGFMDPQTFQTGVGGWPQNLRSVVSVGGTELLADPNSPTGFLQQAWDGSGSGCSPDLPGAYGQPTWIVNDCRGGRAVVDISADASPASGPAIYDSYAPSSHQPPGWLVEGGTSASSPFVAAIAARANLPTDMIGPNDLYRAPASAYTDITAGINAPQGTCQSYGFARRVCQAVNGWDGPTGLGTPRGIAPFVRR